MCIAETRSTVRHRLIHSTAGVVDDQTPISVLVISLSVSCPGLCMGYAPQMREVFTGLHLADKDNHQLQVHRHSPSPELTVFTHENNLV